MHMDGVQRIGVMPGRVTDDDFEFVDADVAPGWPADRARIGGYHFSVVAGDSNQDGAASGAYRLPRTGRRCGCPAERRYRYAAPSRVGGVEVNLVEIVGFEGFGFTNVVAKLAENFVSVFRRLQHEVLRNTRLNSQFVT